MHDAPQQVSWRVLFQKGWQGFYTALKGMRITFINAFRRPITLIYPKEHLDLPVFYRGRHRQRVDENGIPWCVACNACARVCPDECITIEAEKWDDPPDTKRKRRITRFEIDLARCMYCGLCEEACPQDCLMLVADYEYSAWDPRDLVLPLSQQLRPKPVSQQELKYAADPASDPARPKPRASTEGGG
jgi:NADH-quinone oxidoreductase subunit I